MAVYKVPQDVEADDKLIGPFSFRQFIYLIIVAIAGFVGYLLSKIFIGLAILVLPIILLFGAIALPLRKDQPMETYLVAVIRFLTKPRVRMWSPEGALTLVTISSPKVIETHLTKDIAGDEAERRLSYLAQVVDTQGWATRGVTHANDAMSDIVIAEAAATRDIFDTDTSISRSFNQMIDQADEDRRQSMIQQMRQGNVQATTLPAASSLSAGDDPTYNPYPASMHQRVIMPAGQQPTAPPSFDPTAAAAQQPAQPPQLQQSAADPVPVPTSPDIMRLANTKDLSISALAHEAHRLEAKDEGEVVVPLR